MTVAWALKHPPEADQILIDRTGEWWLDFRPRLRLARGGAYPDGTLGAEKSRGHAATLTDVSTSDFVDTLVYGENLEILQRFITDESVDLVYLDPPFSGNREYSLIFKDESGRTSDAQLASFEESWHWGPTPERHYEYLTNGELHEGRVPHGVSSLIGALRESIRPTPMLAYLVEMATRLVELHRVLKPTGSLYLHCDPTASHYLKLLLDAVFGPDRFLSEVIWKRSGAHSSAKRPAPIHDSLLLYSKTDKYTWNVIYSERDPEYIRTHYSMVDEDGRRFQPVTLHASGVRAGSSGQPWHGIDITAKGGHWKYRIEGLEKLDAAGKVYWPPSGGMPRLKQYLDDGKGTPLQDVWTDIPPLNAVAKERLGYPTQKPLALLARIIAASSNDGDLVLDPFCGCGTAIEAAQAAGRHWIGIDLSNHAVEVIQRRMEAIGSEIRVFDWPTEVDGVRRMVEAPGGRHRFEAWALTRLNAQPVRELGGRGADQGIDGRIRFTLPSGRVETIIVSVKSGHVGPSVIRDLKGTVERERAAMGLLFTLQEPTSAMRHESAAGFYRIPQGESYPRIVVATVNDLFEGRMPDLPSRYGVQLGAWQHLPTASRAVRVRPARLAPSRARPTPVEPDERVVAIRDSLIGSASREEPRFPRTSKRDRQSQPSSRES